jgi:hypothetical protein
VDPNWSSLNLNNNLSDLDGDFLGVFLNLLQMSLDNLESFDGDFDLLDVLNLLSLDDDFV